MKTFFSKRCFRLGLSIAMAVLASCSERVTSTGGGMEDGNASIICIINDNRGETVDRAAIMLFSTGYNPLSSDTDQVRADAKSDNLGYSTFFDLPEGSYNILAYHPLNTSSAVARHIEVTGDGFVDTVRMILTPSGSLTMYLAELGISEGEHVYIPGTSMVKKISADDLETGMITLNVVPAGTYPDIIAEDLLGESRPLYPAGPTVVPPGETVVFGPYAQWEHSAEVTLNTSSSGAHILDDLYGFPLLIRVDSSIEKSSSDGADLRFTKVNRVTPLPYEIEHWDGVGKGATVWVRLDTVYSNEEFNRIIMFWGKSGTEDRSDGEAVFDSSSGFAAVWHMDKSLSDITGNNNGCINLGSDHLGDGITGPGRIQTDSGDVILCRVGPALQKLVSTISVSGWIKTSMSAGEWASIFRFGYRMTPLQITDHNSLAQVVVWNPNYNEKPFTWNGVFNDGEWHHVLSQYDSVEGLRVFKDGRLLFSAAMTGNLNNNDKPQYFGIGGTSDGLESFMGKMDEVRVSHEFRSEEWVRLSYETQKSGTDAVTVRQVQ